MAFQYLAQNHQVQFVIINGQHPQTFQHLIVQMALGLCHGNLDMRAIGNQFKQGAFDS